MSPSNTKHVSDLDLDGNWLHMQRVFVEGVEGVVPHDVRLRDVAAATSQHEQSLVQLHGFICNIKDYFSSPLTFMVSSLNMKRGLQSDLVSGNLEPPAGSRRAT